MFSFFNVNDFFHNHIIIHNSNYKDKERINEIHNSKGVNVNLSWHGKYSYQEIIDLILI